MTRTKPSPLYQNYFVKNDTLLIAILCATLIHAFLLFELNFTSLKPAKTNHSMEITVSHTTAKLAPKKSNFLAAEHQIASPDTAQSTLQTQEDSVAQLSETAKNIAKTSKPHAFKETQKPVLHNIVSQPESNTKKLSTVQQTEQTNQQIEEDRPKLSTETLQQQISQLGEQIRTSQLPSQEAKIKFASAISSHKFLAAQYVRDWEDKVERTGNMNYPEAARHPSETQTLTMNVGINADGSIYSIQVVKSSGNLKLDDAAKKIVRMSAPFAELPYDLLKEVNVLVITRIWTFSDETGITTH